MDHKLKTIVFFIIMLPIILGFYKSIIFFQNRMLSNIKKNIAEEKYYHVRRILKKIFYMPFSQLELIDKFVTNEEYESIAREYYKFRNRMYLVILAYLLSFILVGMIWKSL